MYLSFRLASQPPTFLCENPAFAQALMRGMRHKGVYCIASVLRSPGRLSTTCRLTRGPS